MRNRWVAALPEEKIRQALLHQMVEQLGYPRGNIAIEKSLHQLPHLQFTPALPKRRADLIVFGKHIHPHHLLYPLLLVECKAVPINARVVRQILGYNHFIQAYAVALVNSKGLYFGEFNTERKEYCFHEELPSYEQLVKNAKEKFKLF